TQNQMKFRLTTFSLLLILGLWNCSGKKSGDESKAFDEASKSIPEEIKGLVYDVVPPPSEIPFLLMRTGAEFNPSLVNDRKKSETYSENEKATLNLGVYAADLGYLISYEKTQESIDYLATCKSLGDKLG